MSNVVSRKVGEAIRQRRVALGLDLTEVARHLGGLGYPFHPDSLSRMERGLRKVSVDELFLLANVLQIEPHDLLAGRSEPAPAPEPVRIPERVPGGEWIFIPNGGGVIIQGGIA